MAFTDGVFRIRENVYRYVLRSAWKLNGSAACSCVKRTDPLLFVGKIAKIVTIKNWHPRLAHCLHIGHAPHALPLEVPHALKLSLKDYRGFTGAEKLALVRLHCYSIHACMTYCSSDFDDVSLFFLTLMQMKHQLYLWRWKLDMVL